MSKYSLDQIKGDELPEGVVFKGLLKTSGDTLGVVFLEEVGGFATWRNGSCIGMFDTVRAAGRALEKREDQERAAWVKSNKRTATQPQGE